MASHSAGRAGVILPPTLPTIKETTLSWLGSDLESSLFSTNGKQEMAEIAQGNSKVVKVQRYIDFDDQCLSMKSGEGSDFSGIQPLPLGSDDTPPMAQNNLKSVVRMDFDDYFVDSEMNFHNRPKPNLSSDSESTDEYLPLPSKSAKDGEERGDGEDEGEGNFVGDVDMSSEDLKELLSVLDRQTDPKLRNLLGGRDDPVMQKLQLMRIWQLMQQEELKRQQESELALLKAQKMENGIEVNLETQQDLGNGNESIHRNDVENFSDEDLVLLDVEPRVQHYQENEKENCHEAENQVVYEVPIGALERKSFEQRVEEELSKEKQKTAELKQQSKAPVKRPFLRKGQGTARFNGPITRKLPKSQPKEQQKKDIAKPQVKAKNLKSQEINNVSLTTNLQRPSQSHRPSNKRVKIPIQKLILKPEPVKSHEANPVKQTPMDDKDLKEFEMLEQYAEDDASFFSEPSLVVSLLRQESETNNFSSECQMTLRERVRERRKAREEARKQVQNNLVLANTAGREENVIGDLATNDFTEATLETQDLGINLNEYLEETLKNELQEDDEDPSENDSPKPPNPYFSSPLVPKAKVIRRKTASLVRKEKLVRPVAHPANCALFSPIQPLMRQDNHIPGLYSSSNSAFSPHQQPIIVNGTGNINANNNAIEVDSLVIDEQENQFQDEQTWGDIDLSVLDTSEDATTKKGESSGREYKSSDYMEPEREDIENPVRDTDTAKMGMDLTKLSLSPPPPPTVLMQKLFPGLKVPNSSRRSAENQQQVVTTSEDEKAVQETAESDAVHASLLKQKLQELEKEISRFKKENAALESLKRQHEETLVHFAKEMEEFKKQKEEELKHLEEHKKTEMKKLKKEKKLFEDHVQATKLYPRKEERQQIQKLTEEVESLKADNKMKEQRWISANGRMRSQIEKLENDNRELNERLQELIEQRAKEWNKKKKAFNSKHPSKWQAVNDMVEDELNHHEMVHSPKSDSAVVMNGQASRLNGNSGRTELKNSKSAQKIKKKGDVERPRPCIKQTKTSNILENDWDAVKQPASASDSGLSETVHKDGKVERALRDGSRVVEFPNGTQKEISADGKTVTVKFSNGDIKNIYADGSIVYFYKENGTTHTTHPDGLQVLEFPNKQVEHHFPDGTKQISFPDQTVKYLHTDGTEQTVFPDGTEMHVTANMDKTIVFANGQREIHTKDFKRREYPDGTSKTVFEDGRQETRYASGRIRVKDSHGNVIIDKMM